VGKIIYTDDAKKLGEYTFSRLLKRVRVVRTKEGTEEAVETEVATDRKK
jgi:hypothetical protein